MRNARRLSMRSVSDDEDITDTQASASVAKTTNSAEDTDNQQDSHALTLLEPAASTAIATVENEEETVNDQQIEGQTHNAQSNNTPSDEALQPQVGTSNTSVPPSTLSAIVAELPTAAEVLGADKVDTPDDTGHGASAHTEETAEVTVQLQRQPRLSQRDTSVLQLQKQPRLSQPKKQSQTHGSDNTRTRRPRKRTNKRVKFAKTSIAVAINTATNGKSVGRTHCTCKCENCEALCGGAQD